MPAPYERGVQPLNSFGFEQITVDSTSGGKSFAATEYDDGTNKPAVGAFCSLETASIRYTTDGTAPTTTVGHLVQPGEAFVVWGSKDIKAFRAIRTGATSGVLTVTYGSVS